MKKDKIAMKNRKWCLYKAIWEKYLYIIFKIKMGGFEKIVKIKLNMRRKYYEIEGQTENTYSLRFQCVGE